MSKSLRRLAAWALLAPALASAQSQRCLVDGRWVFSDRGCAPDTGRLVSIGPLQTAPRGALSVAPRLDSAPPYLAAMGPHCAGLHDAIRTAAVRGLNHDTLSGLRRDYDQDCRDEERDAQSRWHDSQREQRQQRVHSTTRRQESASQLKSLCDGLRDVILSRHRSQLSADGQAQARAMYEQRCSTVRASD